MKTIRSGLFLLITAALATVPALRAADAPPPPPGGEHRERFQEGGERMAEALGLSEDQKVKMKAINQQEKAELDALRASAAGNKEAMKAQAQEIRKKYREQRHAIMTPEQRAKADEMRGKMEKRKERREERREKPGA